MDMRMAIHRIAAMLHWLRWPQGPLLTSSNPFSSLFLRAWLEIRGECGTNAEESDGPVQVSTWDIFHCLRTEEIFTVVADAKTRSQIHTRQNYLQTSSSFSPRWSMGMGEYSSNYCYIEAWIENTKEKYDIQNGVNSGMVRINRNNIHPCMDDGHAWYQGSGGILYLVNCRQLCRWGSLRVSVIWQSDHFAQIPDIGGGLFGLWKQNNSENLSSYVCHIRKLPYMCKFRCKSKLNGQWQCQCDQVSQAVV